MVVKRIRSYVVVIATISTILVGAGYAAAESVSNSGAPVFVNVTDETETPTGTVSPTPTDTASETPTATGTVIETPTSTTTASETPTSTVTETATATDDAKSTATVPVITELPETGVKGTHAASYALLIMLSAGFLLVAGALVGSRRSMR